MSFQNGESRQIQTFENQEIHRQAVVLEAGKWPEHLEDTVLRVLPSSTCFTFT